MTTVHIAHVPKIVLLIVTGNTIHGLCMCVFKDCMTHVGIILVDKNKQPQLAQTG